MHIDYTQCSDDLAERLERSQHTAIPVLYTAVTRYINKCRLLMYLVSVRCLDLHSLGKTVSSWCAE